VSVRTVSPKWAVINVSRANADSLKSAPAISVPDKSIPARLFQANCMSRFIVASEFGPYTARDAGFAGMYSLGLAKPFTSFTTMPMMLARSRRSSE
jgi:hypothetical protein